MFKFSKKIKRAAVCILAAAVMVVSLPLSGILAQAGTGDLPGVSFDSANVVLKIGVLSDVHLCYGGDTLANIKRKVTNYANAVATLDSLSGNDLDMLMLAGDYTGTGNIAQAETFASASKAAVDAINAGKPANDKTKFLMAYGNHDTEWSGQMDYEGWESLLNSYGLLGDVTKGPEDSGCYKATAVKNGKTYHFYSLETENYNNPSNTFLVESLNWLDTELATVTAEEPDSYVYVISHGPIAESGVYGSDFEFEKNANWGTAEAGITGTSRGKATSSDINGVLAKYPQVMYFSGHTHFTNALESTIMSKDYTAVTVGALNSADLYNTVSNYLDAGTGVSKPGYGLYLEIDANGNQRINRVNLTTGNNAATSVTYSAEYDAELGNGRPNPSHTSTAGEPETISAVVVDSVTILSNGAPQAVFTPWVMPAPSADNLHLAYYSKDRAATPVFANGAAVTVESINQSADGLTFDFTFPTATSPTNIIRYEIAVCDQNGNAVENRWILGNWCDNTDGVTEVGKTHLNATQLKYSITASNPGSITGFYAKITAVDEFGGRSTPIVSALQELGISKPTTAGANKNMFDGMTLDRAIAAADTATTSLDSQTGRVVTDFNLGANAFTKVKYITSADKYNFLTRAGGQGTTYTSWDSPGKSADWYTDLTANDTYVYESDFKVSDSSNGYISFHIRTADIKSSYADSWKTDYTGIKVDGGGVALWICQTELARSDAFKLTKDNTVHHITAVSTPTSMSVWIDDIQVFDEQEFRVTDAVTALSADSLDSYNMVPTMAIWAVNINAQITNQYLYLYDRQLQTGDAVSASEVNYYDSGKMTYTGSIVNSGDATYPNPVVGRNTIKAYAKFNAASVYDIATIKGNLDTSKFNVTDTVITEFDFTPSDLSIGSEDSRTLHDLQVYFRGNATENVSLLMRSKGTYIFYKGTAVPVSISTGALLCEGKTLHLKIVSDNEKATIYVNNIAIAENLVYTAGNSEINTAAMTPYFDIMLRNGRFEIENIRIRKADGSGTIPDVTAFTSPDQNLLNSGYRNIITNLTNMNITASDSMVNGTNLYTDLRWFNLEAGNYSNFYMGEDFNFFGMANTGFSVKKNESFVLSALCRISNGSLTKDTTTYPARIKVVAANYNGQNAWYFIQDTYLSVYYNGVREAYINLADSIGYSIGDYIRLTTSVSPYGYDIYIDGLKIYSYVFADQTLVDYNSTIIGANGGEVRFLDTVMYYNNDNAAVYSDSLLKEVHTWENLKGVYFADKTSANTKVTAIKTACNTLVSSGTTSNAAIKQYTGVIERYISSGKIVNNMVYDKTAVIPAIKSIDMSGVVFGTWNAVNVPLFNAGQCPLTVDDTWIFEADVKASDFKHNNVRIGFSVKNAGEANVMIQNSTPYYWSVTENTWKTMANAAGNTATNLRNGGEWHVKYTVSSDSSLRTQVTSVDGATKYFDYTVNLNSMGYNLTTADIAPKLYVVSGNYTYTNVYLGYDLTADLSALQNEVTTANGINLSDKTITSAASFTTALTGAQTVLDNSDAYTKSEIVSAKTGLSQAAANLTTAVNAITVGGAAENTDAVNINVNYGDMLPVNCEISGKYITGWSVDGADASSESITYESGKTYKAEYVDTKMLVVAYQNSTPAGGKVDTRFIASVNNLNYKSVGWVFSLTDANPTIGRNGCVERNSTRVYNTLLASGVPKTAADIYDAYSSHLFAFEIKNINVGTGIYVRSYVELEDGRIIYSDARRVTAGN